MTIISRVNLNRSILSFVYDVYIQFFAAKLVFLALCKVGLCFKKVHKCCFVFENTRCVHKCYISCVWDETYMHICWNDYRGDQIEYG